MKSKNWRSNLDESTRRYLELQIRETFKHNKAYNRSKNPSNAQLWIAVANLSKHIFELNLRMNVLERALKETLEKINRKEIKKPTVKKIIKKKTKKKRRK